jgi:hypothetical protein
MDGVMRHLVHNNGQLTAQKIADFAATFIRQETHQAQNDVQLYRK